jgi:hypothetical protein
MLRRDDGSIFAISLSPDDRFLAAVSEDGALTVWELGGGSVLYRRDTGAAPASVAFSPDSKILAVGYENGTLRLLNAESGRTLLEIPAHGRCIRSVTWSPDGSLIATGGDDNAAKVWNGATGEIVRTFNRHTDWVQSVAFSPDGSLLATASDDESVGIWSVETGELLDLIQGHTGYVMSVAFSPDGSMIASGSLDGTVRTGNVSEIIAGVGERGNAEELHRALTDSARFLNRRNPLLQINPSPTLLTEVLRIISAEVDSSRENLDSALWGIVGTSKTPNFQAENNPNVKKAQASRDLLNRNLLALRAILVAVEHSDWDSQQKSTLIANATEIWADAAYGLLDLFPMLADSKIEHAASSEQYDWERRMRMLARRQSITAEELLRAAPSDPQVATLKPHVQARIWLAKVQLLGLENDYDEILRICRMLAPENTDLADELAVAAVSGLAILPEYAGRSERGREGARAMRAPNFGAFIRGLEGIEGLEQFRSGVVEAYAAFCETRRPITESDMRSVLEPLQDRTEQEISGFVTMMLKLLAKIEKPKAASAAAATDVNRADPAATISEEYAALDALVADWQRDHGGWQADLIRARVLFAWGTHQLDFVRVGEGARGGSAAAVTISDAEGFRRHMEEWRRQITSAASRLLADDSMDTPGMQQAASMVLEAWFEGAFQLRTNPAYRESREGELLEAIANWLARLPTDLRNRILQDFAIAQTKRFDPSPGEDQEDEAKPEIAHEHKYEFVKSVAFLASETEEGKLFAEIQREYESFGTGVEFHVVPEGEIYDSGSWAQGAMPTYPVNASEFGVWFTLLHTPEARRASGGFHRYIQNGPAVSGDEFALLSDTERTRYAEDFKESLKRQLAGSFDVVLVELNLRTEIRRDIDRNGVTWQETPLYYAVLRPKAVASAREIPPVKTDLDFPHEFGRVVLPFTSQRIVLRPEEGRASHVRHAVVRQEIDDSRRDQGEIVLTITSESLGLPPPPHEQAANLPPDGFSIEPTLIDSKIEILDFPAGTTSAYVKRTTTYRLDWLGGGFFATVAFPSYDPGAGGEPWEVNNFLKRPGDIQQRPIPGGRVSLDGFPWRWESVARWARGALLWGAIGLAGTIGVLGAVRFSKRRKTSEKPRLHLARPAKNTPLAAANFLRRIAVNPSIRLSESQTEDLQNEIERLENNALSAAGEAAADASATIDKWMAIARERHDAAS